MISPTGKGIRNDAGGLGHWGAPRGDKLHKGVDFKSHFTQDIVAPFDMFIKRVSKPNESYLSGIAFETDSSNGRMWYFSPFKEAIGTKVKQGEVIGTAQALQIHYGNKVTDHIHFQFNEVDPMIFMKFASILKGMRAIKEQE